MVPVPSVAMKESIFTRVTRRPLTSPTSAPSSSTAPTAAHQGRPCPCRPMASTCEMPTIEAGREVELVGGHRDQHRQRDQRLHRLVAEDRADVEIGEEGVGPQEREDDDEQDEQDQQSPDRDRRATSADADGARAPIPFADAAPHRAAPRRRPSACVVRRAIVSSPSAESRRRRGRGRRPARGGRCARPPRSRTRSAAPPCPSSGDCCSRW